MSSLSYIHRRAALVSIGAAVFGPSAAAIDIHESAPRFWAKSLDGARHTNESLKGKVTLIQFWATWCPHCREDQPAVEALVEEFTNQGLVVLAVDVGETRKKVREYLERSPRSCRIVLAEDTNLAAVFAANAYPMYVLIDRDGKLVGELRGALGEDRLRSFLRKARLESQGLR